MRIGLGMFVRVNRGGVIEQIPVAFRHRFQLRNEIRELFHMPAANVAQHALPFHPIGPGDLYLPRACNRDAAQTYTQAMEIA